MRSGPLTEGRLEMVSKPLIVYMFTRIPHNWATVTEEPGCLWPCVLEEGRSPHLRAGASAPVSEVTVCQLPESTSATQVRQISTTALSFSVRLRKLEIQNSGFSEVQVSFLPGGDSNGLLGTQDTRSLE